jgi:hypothetical protein
MSELQTKIKKDKKLVIKMINPSGHIANVYNTGIVVEYVPVFKWQNTQRFESSKKAINNLKRNKYTKYK